MSSSLVLTALLSLGAAVLLSAPAGAQSQTDTRAFVEKVTNNTTPKRQRFRPYRFTTQGRVVAPTRKCTPGTRPTPARNCIPKICAPGSSDPRYCQDPTGAAICSGIVNVRFQNDDTTISSRNVKVRSDCTYRSTVTFRKRLRTRVGKLRVRARFQGNAVLRPKTSLTHTVTAG
ncbi:MAG TPA: hypothetical protein VGO80_13555 [Solirubrobacteraceae bacterium]|nr:hypothetical protein [Solirubrobacteraceae bacterium]